ncbi:hypothetical protein CK222_23445 [Mesorhizobium sp. WSM3866]|uniref:hypothetical protein n=1 Tax=Mesorhizobium sp. WSM3866 TaxID=422271 RepID=UPI000BB05F50|nr:hypothetical protein [Mesorhizobium sp. WSM3866]PBB41136.1 hypothetical protein CK222_23445 [Mesorhizobium sp. WSM3866]
MNRNRRNSFGRRMTCERSAPVAPPPIVDERLRNDRQYGSMGGEGELTEKGQAKDRVEALGVIVCRLDELRQLAASQGLELIGYLLDVAFNESCDAIRRERLSAHGQETTG